MSADTGRKKMQTRKKKAKQLMCTNPKKKVLGTMFSNEGAGKRNRAMFHQNIIKLLADHCGGGWTVFFSDCQESSFFFLFYFFFMKALILL